MSLSKILGRNICLIINDCLFHDISFRTPSLEHKEKTKELFRTYKEYSVFSEKFVVMRMVLLGDNPSEGNWLRESEWCKMRNLIIGEHNKMRVLTMERLQKDGFDNDEVDNYLEDIETEYEQTYSNIPVFYDDVGELLCRQNNYSFVSMSKSQRMTIANNLIESSTN